ncbi:hypothetical protein OPQ81_008997 [Rhizoctonia solani]|nr:hypothetical protein OPQ81_008997 [Rhizoctonia solani]
MPRPSKRKLAARDNLLKARAKMNLLRSLRGDLESAGVQKADSVKTENHVYSNGMATENSDQPKSILQDEATVAVFSTPSPELKKHRKEVASKPNLPNEDACVMERSRDKIDERDLHYNQSMRQLFDGGVAHSRPLDENPCPKDSDYGIKVKPGLIPEGEASERTEALRPIEKRSGSYLKMYKENFRASKKMRLASQISATDVDHQKAEDVLIEGFRMAVVGV